MSNENLRFISKSKTAFKIHIHAPDDTVVHRSVGYIRLGEEKGLKKAIQLRNKLGKELWKKFWPQVLADKQLLIRLPHSLEPKQVNKPAPTLTDPNHRLLCYLAKWHEFDEEGNKTIKTMVRSTGRYGKLAAYTQTKEALMNAYKDQIPILEFMGRFAFVKLK